MREVCACDSCNTKMIPTLTSSLAGYWKWTPSNWISPMSPGSFFPVLLRLSISGIRSSTEKMAAAEPLATANASRCGVVRPMFIAPDSTPNKTYVHDNTNIQSCIIRLWSMKWNSVDKPDNIGSISIRCVRNWLSITVIAGAHSPRFHKGRDSIFPGQLKHKINRLFTSI